MLNLSLKFLNNKKTPILPSGKIREDGMPPWYHFYLLSISRQKASSGAIAPTAVKGGPFMISPEINYYSNFIIS